MQIKKNGNILIYEYFYCCNSIKRGTIITVNDNFKIVTFSCPLRNNEKKIMYALPFNHDFDFDAEIYLLGVIKLLKNSKLMKYLFEALR